MFGKKGAELCQELASTDKGQLRGFNNDLFNQVLDEANEHYKHLEARFTKIHNDGLDTRTARNGDFYGGFIHHSSIVRNKRCLLAYLYHRAQVVQSLRWQLGAVLPQEIQNKLSYSEKTLFKCYSDSLAIYMSSLDLDLCVNLSPPKDPYIQVRVLDDIGELFIDNLTTSLVRNSIHLLKRSEAESLISQGLLEEFVT